MHQASTCLVINALFHFFLCQNTLKLLILTGCVVCVRPTFLMIPSMHEPGGWLCVCLCEYMCLCTTMCIVKHEREICKEREREKGREKERERERESVCV